MLKYSFWWSALCHLVRCWCLNSRPKFFVFILYPKTQKKADLNFLTLWPLFRALFNHFLDHNGPWTPNERKNCRTKNIFVISNLKRVTMIFFKFFWPLWIFEILGVKGPKKGVREVKKLFNYFFRVCGPIKHPKSIGL